MGNSLVSVRIMHPFGEDLPDEILDYKVASELNRHGRERIDSDGRLKPMVYEFKKAPFYLALNEYQLTPFTQEDMTHVWNCRKGSHAEVHKRSLEHLIRLTTLSANKESIEDAGKKLTRNKRELGMAATIASSFVASLAADTVGKLLDSYVFKEPNAAVVDPFENSYPTWKIVDEMGIMVIFDKNVAYEYCSSEPFKENRDGLDLPDTLNFGQAYKRAVTIAGEKR